MMDLRKLGLDGLTVSALGLGCMKLYDSSTDEIEPSKVIRYAIEHGINFLDTADVYAAGMHEKLLGKISAEGYRDKIILATKCGFAKSEKTSTSDLLVDASPKHIKEACDASLQRLGVEYIDLYYLHRASREVSIEDSVGALSDLVQAGKIRYIGLSEVTPKTLRLAHRVHPITALQSEYSLWQREPEKEILKTCRELGIGFVAFSPLGRGFLTGTIRDTSSLQPNDFRKKIPRFQEGNFQKNLILIDHLTDFAKKKNCTAAQLSLAWLLAQGEDIVPIPATRSVQRLQENIDSVSIKLTKEDLKEINQIIPIDAASGDRYTEYLQSQVI